jgi:AraC-like DNA-binding protein
MVSRRTIQFVDRCQTLIGRAVIGAPAARILREALESMPVPRRRAESLFIRHLVLQLAARLLPLDQLPTPVTAEILRASASPSEDLNGLIRAVENAMRCLSDMQGMASPISPTDGDGRASQRVSRAIALIDERFGDPNLTLKTLATALNLSPCHLSRLLKRYSHHGFVQHVHRRRVAKACELLAHGSLTVKEIAATVGYTRTSELDHHFKRLLGVTPTMHARMRNR